MKLRPRHYRHVPSNFHSRRKDSLHSGKRRYPGSMAIGSTPVKPASSPTRPTAGTRNDSNHETLPARQWLCLLHPKPGSFEPRNLKMQIYVLETVDNVYDLWTKFNILPHFTRGRRYTEPQEDSRCVWLINLAGREVVWDAEIDEQAPTMHITWKSCTGATFTHHGSVSFRAVRPHICRIEMDMTFELPVEMGDGALNDLAEKWRRTFVSFVAFVAKHRMVSEIKIFRL